MSDELLDKLREELRKAAVRFMAVAKPSEQIHLIRLEVKDGDSVEVPMTEPDVADEPQPGEPPKDPGGE